MLNKVNNNKVAILSTNNKLVLAIIYKIRDFYNNKYTNAKQQI